MLVLNEDIVGWLDIAEDEAEQLASQEAREMERRVRLFRGDRPEPVLKGETVILVDDGIATGMTVRAAIECLRQQEPEYLVLAVPVCAAETAEELRSEVDDLVCLRTPLELWATGTRTSSRSLTRRSWSCSNVLVAVRRESAGHIITSVGAEAG